MEIRIQSEEDELEWTMKKPLDYKPIGVDYESIKLFSPIANQSWTDWEVCNQNLLVWKLEADCNLESYLTYKPNWSELKLIKTIKRGKLNNNN
jgi:hypothetical protein